MQKTITFELTTPLKYAHKGEEVEGMFVEMSAPTSRNLSECAFIKQAFMRSLPNDPTTQVVTDNETKEAITGDEVLTLMYMSGVDMSPVLGHARALFTSGVVLVDGEEKITKPLFDKISQEDFEAMLGEYLINFILASALRTMKKK